MVIEGFWWFVGAILICGAHVLYLRNWRRERLQHMPWWQRHDAEARQQHEEIMRALDGQDKELGWSLDGGSARGAGVTDSSVSSPSEKPLEVRLHALALSLALELDGSLEHDSITTVEHLASEACRDLAHARNGMCDLREALREALQIAWARGYGEFSPVHADRLAALETILAGWSE